MTAKNQWCLWYDHDAEEAAKLYAATFPDTRINCVQAAPGDYPDGQKGKTLMVEMTIMGIPTLLLNGGPTFPQSESFSFQVMTEDRSEEHTSELQSLMRNSYAVFCLKKKTQPTHTHA